MTAERFVGRDFELRQLRGLLDKAAGGHAGTVVLGGEAGVGKSRLLAQFAAQAEKEHGAHVLRGGCIELSGGLIPYAPLVESLRLLVRERGEDEIRTAITDTTWDGLAHLVSDFTGTAVAAGPEAASSGSGQLRVFGAVLRMLEHLGRSAPVVLVFEDMHWADRSTLDLVSFLARRLSSERALLVCSHRSVLVPGHALRVLLAEPEFSRHVHPVPLPAFNERDLKEFIGELLPDTDAPPDRDLARRCYELSGGNAYFAEQLVLFRALTDPNARRVPESINELMLARIATLSEPARRVMQVAAAAARQLDDRLLEAVSGLQDNVLDGALHECRDQGMLVLDPVDEAYAIQHALLSEAVYQQMGIGERRRLHTKMAQALTADVALGLAHGWSAAVELAHHWFHTDHRAEALASAVRAGEATMAVRAFHEAESQFGRVLDDLWAKVPDPEAAAGRSRADLLAAAAEASRWAGHVAQAVDRVQKAIDDGAVQGDPLRLGELYERLGSYHWEAGAIDKGQSPYAEAVRLLEAAAPEGAAHARALVGLAMAEIKTGSYQAALERSEQAVELAETTGDAAVKGRALSAAGLALAMLGRGREGEPWLRQAVELADQEDHLEDLLRAYANLAVALELSGDLDGSVTAARTGLHRAQTLDLTELRLAIVLANNAGASLMQLGRWDEAGEVLERAMADRPRVEPSAYLRLTLAEFDVARGRHDEAEHLMSEVSDQRITDPRFVAALFTCEAELWCWKDQPSRALDAVHRGLDAVADTENVLVRLRLHAVGLRATADRAVRAADQGTQTSDGSVLGAELIAAAERQAATSPETREVQILLQLCRAEHHRVLGEDSVPMWGEVARAWEEIGCPYPTAYARWRQAAAALASADAQAMAAAAAKALDIATRLRAVPLKNAVEKLIGDPVSQEPDSLLGEPVPVPGPTPAAAPGPSTTPTPAAHRYNLTNREWQIYRLMVAKAATNRQIARELTIEDTTVATHVHRIYGKLKVPNRAAAVRKAYVEGLFEDIRGPAPAAE